MTNLSVRVADVYAQRDNVMADATFVTALSATPAQIDAWLATNVTNITQARVVLSMLMRAVTYLMNSQNPPATTQQ